MESELSVTVKEKKEERKGVEGGREAETEVIVTFIDMSEERAGKIKGGGKGRRREVWEQRTRQR